MISVPIPPQYRLLAAIIVAIALLVLGFGTGWQARDWQADADIASIMADLAKKRESAIAQAREEERKEQERINEALRKQNREVLSINDGLRRDLEWVRHRAARPATRMPEAGRPACAGTSGRELSSEDAEFLVRLAAEADILRAGLATCYDIIDGAQP